MSKSLNDILAELGYESWPSQYPSKKRIMKDGELVGSMSAGAGLELFTASAPGIF